MILLLRTFFVRTLIITFWMVLLFLFLFSPSVTKLFKEEKSLTIFTFPLLLDADYIAQFEQRTGIRVYIHYYENNNELLTKLRAGKQHGYDLIFPSDYAVQVLVEDNLLKKVDKSRLAFWERLDPTLLNLYFDPNNNYSLPYLWEVYGLGFDRSFFGEKAPEESWGLIFDERISPQHIGMNNTAREAVSMAAVYLFGTAEGLDAHKLQKIKELMIAQKKRVEVYTDLRADTLLQSKTCSVVACPADDVWMQDDSNLGFFVPKEGSFISIDSVCIPKGAKKLDFIYQFINHLYEYDVMKHHVEKYAFFPAIAGIPVVPRGEAIMKKTLQEFNKFHFFKGAIPEQQLSELWIALKAE